jgi:hypothetical protein
MDHGLIKMKEKKLTTNQGVPVTGNQNSIRWEKNVINGNYLFKF